MFAHLIAKKPSKHKYLEIVIISTNPALLSISKFPCVEKGSKTPFKDNVFDRISSLL